MHVYGDRPVGYRDDESFLKDLVKYLEGNGINIIDEKQDPKSQHTIDTTIRIVVEKEDLNDNLNLRSNIVDHFNIDFNRLKVWYVENV